MSRDISIPITEEELRDTWLQDAALAADSVGLPVPSSQEGEWFVNGTATARAVQQGVMRVALAETNHSIYTCDADTLEETRKSRGLPEVVPQRSRGLALPKITGTASISEGQEFTYKSSGRRGRVLLSYIGISQGAEIEVEALEPGKSGDATGGEFIEFVPAPLNVNPKATISIGVPMTGGTDLEDPEELRLRIIEDMGSRAAGGNAADLVETIRRSDRRLRPYVYSCSGGPSVVTVAVLRDYDVPNRLITRVPSADQLSRAAALLHSELPQEPNIFVLAVLEQAADFTLTAKLPVVSAGNGWVDAAPWPPLVNDDNGRVSISSVGSDGYSIVVSAESATAPVNGKTTIAWWSSVDKEFRTSVVLSSSGSAPSRALVLQTPLVTNAGSPPTVGDYICPASKNIITYGKTWIELFGKLGPGELTTDTVFKLPRTLRYPDITDVDPCDIGDLSIFQRHPEMVGARLEYAPVTTPTIPATVATAPYVLKPRHFGIYPL